MQVDIEKPLGLQLGAAKGPNGGLVVKVRHLETRYCLTHQHRTLLKWLLTTPGLAVCVWQCSQSWSEEW